MSTRSSARPWLPPLLVGALASQGSTAFATSPWQPGGADDDAAANAAVAPWPGASGSPSPESTLSVSIAVGRGDDDRHHVAGGVVASLPTFAWLGGSPAGRDGASRAAPASHQPTASTAGDEAADRPSTSPPATTEPCLEQPMAPDHDTAGGGHRTGRDRIVPIRPADARAAWRAAARAAGFPEHRARLDDLASRARWSSALPQVRLRVTRVIDESASLSPTSYDAERRTATGGASLWLEARTTWHLDRALFATEEVRLERLRRSAAQEQRRASRRALDLLFAWQQAFAELSLLDPALSPTECLAAVLHERRLAVELDLATGGWFQRWRRGSHPAAEIRCPLE